MNYTLNMVGGTSGGLIDNTSDSKSFHGAQEITAEKYFLCARQLEPNLGIGTYQVSCPFNSFRSCLLYRNFRRITLTFTFTATVGKLYELLERIRRNRHLHLLLAQRNRREGQNLRRLVTITVTLNLPLTRTLTLTTIPTLTLTLTLAQRHTASTLALFLRVFR